MIEQINQLAILWWNWMFNMFWQVSLLFLLIGITDLLIRKWVWPQVRYVLWLMVFVKLILPPTLSTSTSITSQMLYFGKNIISNNTAKANLVLQSETTELRKSSLEKNSTPDFNRKRSFLLNHGSSKRSDLIWQAYAMGLWFFIVVMLSVTLMTRLKRLHFSQMSKNQILPDWFHPLLLECASRLKLRRIPTAVITDKLNSPAIFGFFQPRLLIPINYLNRHSHGDIKNILLHELAHVKRGDLLVHGVQCVLQIIYWFNPLLPIVRKQVRRLREICCDTSVAQLLKEKTEKYRQTLLVSAQQLIAQHAEPGVGILGLIEDQNMITERLKWLKKNNWQHRRLKFVIANIVFIVMCFSILPMTRAEKQRIKPYDDSKNEQPINNSNPLHQIPPNSSFGIKSITEETKEDKMEKKYLQNVAPLQTNTTDADAAGRECYLFGTLEATLKYLGEPIDYYYLMGISGCAFRIVVLEGAISACGPDVSSDYYYPYAIKAVGYQDVEGLEGCGGEAWKDIPNIQQAMKHSINNNVPVLTFNPFPFWGIIIGYEKDEFIVSRYFKPETKTYIDEGAFHIIEKTGNVEKNINLVRESFRIAVEHSNKKRLYAYRNGIAGYKEWIKQLRSPLTEILKPKRFSLWNRNNTTYDDYWHANSW